MFLVSSSRIQILQFILMKKKQKECKLAILQTSLTGEEKKNSRIRRLKLSVILKPFFVSLCLFAL